MNTNTQHAWVENSDPSWHKSVLLKLEEKYPGIAAEIWSETIAENAKQLEEHAESVRRGRELLAIAEAELDK